MQRTIRKIPIKHMPETQKKRVAAYARVSDSKLAMLESLAAQTSHYSGFIQSQPGWVYAGVFFDEGVTGTKVGRKGFQEMLTACREGKVDMIITKSVSRFARNTLTLLETVRALKSLGVDVFFEGQNLHTMSAEGEVLLTLLAACAQEESRAVSDNCKWRIRKNYENGIAKSGLRVYGYKPKDRDYRIVRSEASTVLKIFTWYILGDGLFTIARKLNAANIPSPMSVRWSMVTVRYILKNERYIGDTLLQKQFVTDHISKRKRPNRGELPQCYVRNAGEAIIPREMFELAQEIAKQRTNKYTPKEPGKRPYPFTGLLVCGACGKSYKRNMVHGIASWNCGTFARQGKGACYSKQIREDTLVAITAEVLGLDAVDSELLSGEMLRERLERIIVPEPYRLLYTLKDGREIERTWQPHSRRDSWDDAARKRASEHSLRRWNL